MPFPILFYQLVVLRIWEETLQHLMTGHPLFNAPAEEVKEPPRQLQHARNTFA